MLQDIAIRHMRRQFDEAHDPNRRPQVGGLRTSPLQGPAAVHSTVLGRLIWLDYGPGQAPPTKTRCDQALNSWPKSAKWNARFAARIEVMSRVSVSGFTSTMLSPPHR